MIPTVAGELTINDLRYLQNNDGNDNDNNDDNENNDNNNDNNNNNDDDVTLYHSQI